MNKKYFKNCFLSLLFPFALIVPLAVGKKTDEGPANSKDNIVVEARLVEIPGTMPPNDLYNYVYIFKYKVLKVVKGKLDSKEILVGEYNPLIPRAAIKDKMDSLVNGNARKFLAGSKYKLSLKAPLEDVWSGAVEDEYFDNADTRYFSVNTDPIP